MLRRGRTEDGQRNLLKYATSCFPRSVLSGSEADETSDFPLSDLAEFYGSGLRHALIDVISGLGNQLGVERETDLGKHWVGVVCAE